MKQMKKRFAALLLALAMVLGLLPTAALAAEGEEEAGPATVTVDFTAQAEGAFLCAPQFGVEVSGDLAERYGYTDAVDGGVSALDVLVKAHETVFGGDFSAEEESYLAVSAEGYLETVFGVETGNCGFTIDRGFPNDGTESEYGGSGYNGYTVAQAPVEEGALVEFFLYQDSYAMDTYTYLTVPGTAAVGETFTVNVSGLCYGWNGYQYATPAAMKAAAGPVEGISIGLVDGSGAVTDL